MVRLHDALRTRRRVGQQADRLSHKEDDGGSSPSSSTVAEVEVDDTPGRDPGGSPFESGRSPHRSGRSGDQRSLIRRASRVRSPLPPPSGQLHRKQRLPCKETVAGSTPAWSTHERAHVAQLGEAPRSDRDQCEFDSRREYRLDEAQLAARRHRKPEVGSSNLSVQTHRCITGASWWIGNHTWP